jgi:hypothetical protein
VSVDGGGSLSGSALDERSALSAWSYQDDFEAVAAAARQGAGNSTDIDVLVGRREHHEQDRSVPLYLCTPSAHTLHILCMHTPL